MSGTRSVVMEGSLDEFDLVSVVQTVGIGRQCTGVELRDEGGRVLGTIFMKGGQLVSANAEGASGVEAVRRMVRTPRGRRFYVYRAAQLNISGRIGSVGQVLAQVLGVSADAHERILMEGSLRDFDLFSLLDAVSLGRQCIGIDVFESSGRRAGSLCLKGGQILYATCGRNAGPAALRELVTRARDGRFVVFKSATQRFGTPFASVSQLRLVPPRASHELLIEVEDLDDADDAEGAEVTQVAGAPGSAAAGPRNEGTVRVRVHPNAAPTRPSARASDTEAGPRPQVAPPAAAPHRFAAQTPLVSPSAVEPRAPSAPPVAQGGPPRTAPGQLPRPLAPLPAALSPSPARPAPVVPAAVPMDTRPPQQPPPPASSGAPAPTRSRPPSTVAPSAAARPGPSSGLPPSAVSAPPAPPLVPATSSAPRLPPAVVAAPVAGAPMPRFRHSETPSARAESPASAAVPFVAPPSLPSPAPQFATESPVIAITSPKGGCGRTTLTLNLGVALARRGHRVVLVDLDDNGLLSALNTSADRPGVLDVAGGRIPLDKAILSSRIERLSILPTGEGDLSAFSSANLAHVLSELAHRADIVLIDCAAGMYGATPAAVAAATHVLSVLSAEPSAMRLAKRHESRLRARAPGRDAAVGIVLNMLDYQSQPSLRALEELSPSTAGRWVFDIPIPRSPAFVEATALGVPIVDGDGLSGPTVAWVFETLAGAVMERCGLLRPVLSCVPLLS